jgi:hypothetical protein
MNETIITISAYAMLLLGIPLVAAKIIWFIPGAISAVVLVQIAGRLDQFADAVIEGFLSLLIACLVFEHLSLPILWAVPVVLILVVSLWSLAREETFKILPSIAGVIIGFLLYPRVLLFISLHMNAHL